MEEIIDIPSYFLCPISLEICKDPVTLSTGITYDRENIEKWLYTIKKNTCPITKQVLIDTELTPNHTLRRLIQAWCTLNASKGIERIPTPKPPVDKAQIMKLISNAKIPRLQIISLRRLKSLAAENDRNKKCIESTNGAIEFLVSLVKQNNDDDAKTMNLMQDGAESTSASDEALGLLYNLQISQDGLKTLMGKNGEFIESLMQILTNGNYQARAYAVLLLKPLLEMADPIRLISLKSEFFVEIVKVLRDQISHPARKAALQILIEICPWGRNRVKAVDAGAVPILIELLLAKSEKRETEMIMVVLDQLCGCAEGRADLLKHGAGIAVVSKKILRVSQLASERAVRILYSLSKFSATSSVLQEMMQVGVVSKLCLVLQVECTLKTKEKAKEILKLHSRVWKNSHCIPPFLLSSYPC
ncbi:U-box domain-containing protein [Thalictrum thalictroides]|uniref:U-box domain-containing protein n=1 Tax=Thalictrum thalictroides TaxID=46969 RepID=A0A7J6X7W9_THATH|nr:U-box domain-containing protein [Thalictrum thalictroides]